MYLIPGLRHGRPGDSLPVLTEKRQKNAIQPGKTQHIILIFCFPGDTIKNCIALSLKRIIMKETKTKRPFYKTLHFRMACLTMVIEIILLIFPIFLLQNSMEYVMSNLIRNQLSTNLNYLEDELVEHTEEEADWNIRDGGLYIEDRLIGDGTKENADTAVFSHCEKESGSYYYSFVRTYNDSELSPEKGHYLRVSGSTKGRSGERIEGTYIEKSIADRLEASPVGECFSVADVEGRQIRTLYRLIYDKDGRAVGVLAAGRSENELTVYARNKLGTASILILAILLLLSLGIGLIFKMMVGKLNRIRTQLELIGSGSFPEKKLGFSVDDELSDVADTINRMADSLKEKDRMGTELSVAADIQQRFLPGEDSHIPDEAVDIAAMMRPAKEIAGDLYDYFMIDDHNLALVIADVSGKGVPASLFMVRTKTLIKSYAQMRLSPGEIMEHTNRALCEGNDEDFFVTAWLGILDLETGVLRYVNAGHNPPMIRKGREGFKELLSGANFVLAGFERIVFDERFVQLSPGDSVLLYTDGVTEAVNEKEELFGTDRLCSCLNRVTEETSRKVISEVSAEVSDFIGNDEQNDDITLLFLTFKGKIKHKEKSSPREFETKEEHLSEILCFAREKLENTELDKRDISGLLAAVEEIFINITSYAYGGAVGIMSLEVCCEEESVSLVFCDYGIPFNPLLRPDPDTKSELCKRKEGGLGIYMVKHYSDDMEYRYEDGKNILRVIKKVR